MHITNWPYPRGYADPHGANLRPSFATVGWILRVYIKGVNAYKYCKKQGIPNFKKVGGHHYIYRKDIES